MNTPAHALLNLAVLSRREPGRQLLPITLGALLPDAPMFLFYLYERLIAGQPEARIWSELYYRPSWQAFFDLFNSIPLALVGLAIAYGLRSRPWMLFCASLILHGLADLPLHREDAHRHFFPFSDWRFSSPVSYWDPAHHAGIVFPLEVLLSLAAAILVSRRLPSRGARLLVWGLMAVYGLFFVFAVVVWMG